MTILRAAWLSNIGNVRRENEDRVLFNETAQLFGVADGVGGLPGGAEAAQKAVDVVTEAVLAAGPDAELDLKADRHGGKRGRGGPRAGDKPRVRNRHAP